MAQEVRWLVNNNRLKVSDVGQIAELALCQRGCFQGNLAAGRIGLVFVGEFGQAHAIDRAQSSGGVGAGRGGGFGFGQGRHGESFLC